MPERSLGELLVYVPAFYWLPLAGTIMKRTMLSFDLPHRIVSDERRYAAFVA